MKPEMLVILADYVYPFRGNRKALQVVDQDSIKRGFTQEACSVLGMGEENMLAANFEESSTSERKDV